MSRGTGSVAAGLLLAAAGLVQGCAGSGSTGSSPVSTPQSGPAEGTAAVTEGRPPSSLLPDTRAGTAAGDWIELFNAGDEEAVSQFLLDRLTPEFLARLPLPALVAFHAQSLEEYGPLTPSAVVESAPDRVVVLADSAEGEELELTIELGEEPPHGIGLLRLVPAASE